MAVPIARRIGNPELSEPLTPEAPPSEWGSMSYEEAWCLHGPSLRRNCIRWMSGDHDLADEAFSRAGLLAYKKYPQHQSGLRKPGAWLARLTYHVCMDLHRELRRRNDREIVDSRKIDRAVDLMLGPKATNPELHALFREKQRYLESCISFLPSKLKNVMESILFEGCSYRELSERTSISQVTLRKRVQTARSLLRSELSRYLRGGK